MKSKAYALRLVSLFSICQPSVNAVADQGGILKIVGSHTLISSGPFGASPEWQDILASVRYAVAQAEWPPAGHPLHQPGQFIIHPQSGKKSGEGNGVVPIKIRPMAMLQADGWLLEHPWEVGQRPQSNELVQQAVIDIENPGPISRTKGSRPGNIDAAKIYPQGLVIVEWETGNISSSHRSINKMALGLVQGKCIAGILVVPNMKLAQFLTDRIGNIEELLSYFPAWRSMNVQNGVLELIVIEQDAQSIEVPKIPKGKDGRAQEGADNAR